MEAQSPVRMWLLHNCKEWLKMYDITLKGKVRELRLNIIELKNDTKTTPRLSVVHRCTSDKVHKYICNLLSTITIVMIKEVTALRNPSEMDREVMIFFNSVHTVDSSMMNMYIPSSIPFWLKKYNFQSF